MVREPGPAGRSADSRPAVELRDVSAAYRAHGASAECAALRGIDLTVERGEILGVLGSAGSGKSALLRLLAGSAARTSPGQAPVVVGGVGWVGGRRIGRMSRRRRAEHAFHVAYLSQSAGTELPPDRTIGETIAEPILARDRRFNRREAGRRVAEMLEAVDLPLAVMGSYPFELSGGTRQRAALAAALVLGPRLLLADEPAAAVDPKATADLTRLFERLRRAVGFSAVIVSHDPRLLRRVADRIAVLDDGRMIAYGPIDDALRAPSHPYTRALAAEFDRVRP